MSSITLILSLLLLIIFTRSPGGPEVDGGWTSIIICIRHSVDITCKLLFCSVLPPLWLLVRFPTCFSVSEGSVKFLLSGL